MSKYRKKPVVIEAVTFNEFVDFGRKSASSHVVNGMPWSFNYNGHPITHENDECYLIPTLEGMMHFTPQDMLITGVNGEIYPCKIDIFEKTYEPADDAHTWTKREIEAYWGINKYSATKMIVVVRLPNGAKEVIVNTDQLQEKFDYYMNAYDSDMKLKANPAIQIDAFLVV